jgi:HSP20 family protein
MGNSPFHGIFSALGREDGKTKSLFSFGTPAKEVLPEPEPVKTEAQVGKVAVDIYEQDDYYIIKIPIAGVRLSDLDIEVNDTILTVRGTRRQTDNVPADQYYLQECFWGSFARSITLPTSIDPKKVRATFNKESVLKIIIPREEKVKIVKINEI